MAQRYSRLSGNIAQPDHILADPLMAFETKRRPGSGKVWRAVTQHDGVQIDSILIDQVKLSKTFCQARTGDFNLTVILGLQRADLTLKIIPDKRGVGTGRFQ